MSKSRSDRITSVRFGDYLNSIPLPAILAVFKAEEWDNFGLVAVNSSLIYSIIDVLTRRPARTEHGARGRTPLHHDRDQPGQTYDRVGDVGCRTRLQAAVAGQIHHRPARDESALRRDYATGQCGDPGAAAHRHGRLRGGNVELLLPYATIEPIRATLLQMFMGEKFGRDPIWEDPYLATEIGQAQISVGCRAVRGAPTVAQDDEPERRRYHSART